MCLTGVDYFSTLGYQPSIAFEAAGTLAPVATIVLVAVTLFGALPVYSHVAECSPNGQGSIAMLERLVHGWTGKLLVLALLGFAATDFVITKTLSAADAAVHLLHNPLWEHVPQAVRTWSENEQRMGLTMLLLIILGATFLRGFREVIGLAVVVVVGYLLLNLIVIGSGLVYLLAHPQHFSAWFDRLTTGHWYILERPFLGNGFWAILATSVLFFPKLALGLSGFETGVAVMPLVRGGDDDTPEQPSGRIRNTRKLLADERDLDVVLPARLFDRHRHADSAGRPVQRQGSDSGRSGAHRPGGGSRAGVPGACRRPARAESVFRRSLWHDVRSGHGGDSEFCRVERDGGAVEPGAAVSAALRHGARVVAGRASAGPAVHDDQSAGYLDFQRRRRGPGRRVCHGRVGADLQCLHGDRDRALPAAERHVAGARALGLRADYDRVLFYGRRPT